MHYLWRHFNMNLHNFVMYSSFWWSAPYHFAHVFHWYTTPLCLQRSLQIENLWFCQKKKCYMAWLMLFEDMRIKMHCCIMLFASVPEYSVCQGSLFMPCSKAKQIKSDKTQKKSDLVSSFHDYGYLFMWSV